MYNVTFVSKELVAERTMLFRFTKPVGPDDTPVFDFVAGQSIDLTLIDPPETDAEGNTRAFSLVSAPHEETLAIATRMRDTAFKRTLAGMEPGARLHVDGPFGSFFLHENSVRTAVMIAGGIGVTPFFSIAKDAAKRGLPHKIILFYSNRRPEDAPFLKEFAQLAKDNPNFVCVPTMTDIRKSSLPWDGEVGFIDHTMFVEYVPKGANAIYYLAGPPRLVTGMRTLLTAMKVSPDDVRFEEFTGYV